MGSVLAYFGTSFEKLYDESDKIRDNKEVTRNISENPQNSP